MLLTLTLLNESCLLGLNALFMSLLLELFIYVFVMCVAWKLHQCSALMVASV